MKGLILYILFFGGMIPLGVHIGRGHLEKWLYSCQSEYFKPICNDHGWVCFYGQSHNYGLPDPRPFYGTTMIFDYPNATCSITYFHGRGRPIHYNYYFLGPLYQNTKCSVIAYEYPGCSVFSYSLSAHDFFFNAYSMLLVNLQNSRYSKNYLMCSSMGCSLLMRLMGDPIEVPWRYLYNLGSLWENKFPQVDGIVLENPPTSLSEVASFHTRYIILPSWIHALIGPEHDWLIPSKLKHQGRILLFTSEKDELVPAEMGYIIYEKYGKTNNITHIILEGANHGDAPSHPKYQKSIQDFILG